MLAREVMITKVITAHQESMVKDVIRLFLEHQVSGIPIVDDSRRVLGIITDGDIMARIRCHRPVYIDLFTTMFIMQDQGAVSDKFKELLELQVTRIMTKKVITVTEDTDVGEVAGLMADHKIKKIPVTSDGVLKGIIGREDIIRVVASRAGEENNPQG